MIEGKKQTFSFEEKTRARGTGHSPVLEAMSVKPDSGIYPAGLIVQKNSAGQIEAATAATKICGVLDEEIDSSKDGSALVVVHGSVKRCLLKVDTAGTEPSKELLAGLSGVSIFVE